MIARLTLALMICVSVVAPCAAQPVEGTWEWVTTEYLAGGADTPATVGHTVQLQFGSDGSFIRYQNETAIHVGTWAVFDIVITPYMVGVLETSAGDTWWSQAVGGDQVLTLVLKDWVELPSGVSGPATRTKTYVTRAPVAEEQSSWGRVKLEYR